ncbi:MAG: hypothetical protein QM749_08035 [Aquabacterium sp.]
MFDTQRRQALDHQHPMARRFWGHLALGSAGVMVVSVFYILSPSAAVTPALGGDLEAARSMTLTDVGTMHWAGLCGVLADPVIAIGALGLGGLRLSGGHTREALGFFWLAIAALLYTLADALVGFSVKPAAQHGLASFSSIKPLFDAMLSGASLGYGLSALLLAWPWVASPLRGPGYLVRHAASRRRTGLGGRDGLPLRVERRAATGRGPHDSDDALCGAGTVACQRRASPRRPCGLNLARSTGMRSG